MSTSTGRFIFRLGSFVLRGVAWLVVAGFSLWACGALWYDFPVAAHGVAAAFAVLLLVLLFLVRGGMKKMLAWALASLAVLGWWLTLQPKADRAWLPDVAQTAWAEVKGDEVTLHNLRACDYRTVTDFTPRWETRTVRLSQLTGIDFAITYWGSPYMAHPIASFQFADAPPVCFSIETRKEQGEKYSAVGGFFRQYELIYIMAEESDVVRLRTSVRQGEDVYLYRLNLTPEQARGRFMDYITALNDLRERPRWYNAATTNCTTSIRSQRDAAKRARWDWRMLVNGKGDELMYERGAFITDGLPFPELRARALIKEVPPTGVESPAEYSRRIRQSRPGFGAPVSLSSPGAPRAQGGGGL